MLLSLSSSCVTGYTNRGHRKGNIIELKLCPSNRDVKNKKAIFDFWFLVFPYWNKLSAQFYYIHHCWYIENKRKPFFYSKLIRLYPLISMYVTEYARSEMKHHIQIPSLTLIYERKCLILFLSCDKSAPPPTQSGFIEENDHLL